MERPFMSIVFSWLMKKFLYGNKNLFEVLPFGPIYILGKEKILLPTL